MRRHAFEAVVVPHLNAAFNYARWLTRNEADEDVMRNAYVYSRAIVVVDGNLNLVKPQVAPAGGRQRASPSSNVA